MPVTADYPGVYVEEDVADDVSRSVTEAEEAADGHVRIPKVRRRGEGGREHDEEDKQDLWPADAS